MHGLLLAGMGNCGKHFPGHGFVRADSHVAVPVDKRSLKAILADDALPYGALSTSLAGVMPAHVIYPKVDHRPAGFSPRWLKDILRGQLGFQGAIFSDDLSMEGARHLDGGDLSYAEAAALALDAGCDLVLLCNQSLGRGDAVDQLLAGLQQQAADHHWRPDPDSEQRRLALLPQTPPLTWDELMHQPAYQRARTPALRRRRGPRRRAMKLRAAMNNSKVPRAATRGPQPARAGGPVTIEMVASAEACRRARSRVLNGTAAVSEEDAGDPGRHRQARLRTQPDGPRAGRRPPSPSASSPRPSTVRSTARRCAASRRSSIRSATGRCSSAATGTRPPRRAASRCCACDGWTASSCSPAACPTRR